MLIRRATPEDALDLQNLINQAFNRTTDWTVEETYFKNPSIITLVAVKENVILATASLHILQKLDRKMGQIEDVVVAPQAQGQGWGNRIIQSLLKEDKVGDCYKVILNTAESTQAFYKKIGFEKGEIQMLKRN